MSAAGRSIPYGTTVDGANWTDGGIALNGPPQKLIALGGAAINTQSGAVIDERGGGDVYATEFVPGTGGSRNVLATSNTYALVPGYEAKVAPYDPSFGATIAPGMSVTLPGGNGIAAGTYTLMPAMYATLPGAYRAVVTSTNAGTTPVNSVAPDGSINHDRHVRQRHQRQPILANRAAADPVEGNVDQVTPRSTSHPATAISPRLLKPTAR